MLYCIQGMRYWTNTRKMKTRFLMIQWRFCVSLSMPWLSFPWSSFVGHLWAGSHSHGCHFDLMEASFGFGWWLGGCRPGYDCGQTVERCHSCIRYASADLGFHPITYTCTLQTSSLNRAAQERQPS